MISKFNKSATVAIVLLMSAAAFMTMVPISSATNDPPLHDGATHLWIQDWTVIDSRTLDSGTLIRMQQHNVTVANGGTLTMDLGAIKFDGSKNGEIGITVKTGGTLIMKNNALIAPWTNKNWFGVFENGSTVTISKSSLQGCQGGTPTTPNTGLYVETDKFTIDQGTILPPTPNQDTMDITAGAKVIMQNSSVFSNAGNGVNVQKGGFLKAADSVFSSPGNAFVGLNLLGGNATLIQDGFLTFNYAAMQVDTNSYLYAKGNTFQGNSVYGLAVSTNAKADLIKNTFINNGAGLRGWGTGSVIESSQNTYQNNDIGILVQDNAYVNSTNDFYTDNAVNGLELKHAKADVKKATVHTFAGPDIHGIYATDISSLDLGASSITDGGGFCSLCVVIGSSAEVHDNTFQGGNTAIFLYEGASAHIKKNTITNPSMAIEASVDSTVQSEGNTISGSSMSLYTDMGSKITSIKDTINLNPFSLAAYSVYNGSMVIHNLKVIGAANSFGADASIGSSISIYDSDLTGLDLALRSSGGVVRSINSTPTGAQAKVWFDTGRIDIGWYGHVKTVWQNGIAAPNATVTFRDKNGTLMNTVKTDATGQSDMELLQTTVMKSGVYDHNTYNIVGDLNGMTGRTGSDVTTNMIGAKAITVMIQDTSIPWLNITTPLEGKSLNVTDLVVSGNFSDTGSGIGGVMLEAKPGVAVGSGKTSYSGFIFSAVGIHEGNYTMYVNVTDVAGNKASAEVNVTIDRTAPALTITKPAGLYATTNTFDLNGTTDKGAKVTVEGTAVNNVNGTFGAPLTLSDGDHRITVTSTDAAGNIVTVSKEVIVDTVPPTMAFNIANGTWIGSTKYSLNGTADETLSKVEAAIGEAESSMDVIQKFAKITLNLTEGKNQLNITATDLAGLSTKYVLIINVDTIAPVLNMTTPQGPFPAYTNKPTLNVTGKITELNLASLTVNGVNATPNAQGNFSASVTLVNGTNTITVIATDKAGNRVQWQNSIIQDTVAPKVTILSPQDGLVTNKAAVEVAFFVDDGTATITLMRIRIRNDQPVRKVGTANLTVGLNTVTVNATDSAGNVGTASIKVTYDNVAQLALTKPTNGKISTTTPYITISGTSEAGAKIYVNDVMITSDQSGTFTYKMLVKEGKTTIIVKAVDPAGNPATKTITATRTEAKQFDMGMLLGLGIVLMIVGLLVGVLVGRMMAKPKKPKSEEEPEPEETKPAPKEEEEEPFTPEEEEEEEAPKQTKPAPKSGHVEDPVQESVSKKTDPAPKEEPKAEPETPKDAKKGDGRWLIVSGERADVTKAKPEPKKDDDSLDSLLKEMDKGKK